MDSYLEIPHRGSINLPMQDRRGGLRRFDFQSGLEYFARGNSPFYLKLALQAVCAFLGFVVAAAIFKTIGIYTGAVTILAIFGIALCGEFLPSLVFSAGLAVAADYFFIPPIGSIFNNREDFEHFAITIVVALIINILIYFLRAAYRTTLFRKQQAEDAEKSMERLLLYVSHDMRNPLASIKVMAQLIQRQSTQPEKCVQFSGKIVQSLNRVNAMIEDLLDVSRARAGKAVPLLFENCDLRSVIRAIVEDFSIGSPVQFTFSGDQPIPGRWGATGIRRAVENLVTNALKYGAAGKPISVQINRRGGFAEIAVHNEGKAIPLGEQATLFESFTRASSAENRKGWGLGLALVKGIAEAHGGTVKVFSEAGAGTIFTLILPIQEAKSFEDEAASTA